MAATFGATCREARVKKGLSLRNVARQVNITPSYLSKVELDQVPAPAGDIIHRLASSLDLDIRALEELAPKRSGDLIAADRVAPVVREFYMLARDRRIEEIERALQAAALVLCRDEELDDFSNRIKRLCDSLAHSEARDREPSSSRLPLLRRRLCAQLSLGFVGERHGSASDQSQVSALLSAAANGLLRILELTVRPTPEVSLAAQCNHNDTPPIQGRFWFMDSPDPLPLNRRDLEFIAQSILETLCAREVNALDVPIGIEQLVERDPSIQLSVEPLNCELKPLGARLFGIARWGKNRAYKQLVVDSSLYEADDTVLHCQCRFAIAHEYAHCVLHLPRMPMHGGFTDQAGRAHLREVEPEGDVAWVEWQANELAANLLMPSALTHEAARQVFRRPLTVVSDMQARHLVSNRPVRFRGIDYPGISRLFDVSASTAAFRLRRLGWLRFAHDPRTTV